VKILHITNAYPSDENPIKGIFIKEQIDSLNNNHITNDVYFIDKLTGGIKAYLKAVKYIFKVKDNYDVVHAHHVFSAIIAIFAGASNKLVTSFLSDGSNEVMFGPKILRALIFKTAYIFSKKRIFKLKSRVGDSSNNYFIQNGVNTKFFKQLNKVTCKKSLGLNINKQYILFVSGQSLYRPEKRYDLFLKVVKELNAQLKSKNLEVLPLAISDVTRETIVLYYNAVDCYLLTSDFEGSPNAVKEALACGTPVVSRNVGSTIDLLKGVPNCEVVDGESAVLLAEAVLNTIVNQEKLNVRDSFMKKNLDTVSVTNQITQIYRDVVKEKV
jgi:teichuronic acid biosynthesis glycosyltransferase TuaC